MDMPVEEITQSKNKKPEKIKGKTEEDIRSTEGTLVRFLRINRRFRGPALLTLSCLLLLAFVTLGYSCWYVATPIVWNWGFNPPSWRGIISLLGVFYLGIIPFVPVALGLETINRIFRLYIEEQESAVKQKFSDLDIDQRAAEKALEANDKTGLIPLIQYSRLQLEAYYSIGLSQTQRSFRYCILAMWIGFAVIISGISLYVLPTTQQQAKMTIGDIHIITIAGGVVIEIISALFLWIYRNSINQLTYFYNRQMYIHNVLLCDRIASSMASPDDTKRVIIERVLERGWNVERLSSPGKGISKLIQKGAKAEVN